MAPPVGQPPAPASGPAQGPRRGPPAGAVSAAAQKAKAAAKTMLRSVFIDDGLPVPLNMSRLTFAISDLRHPSSPTADTIDNVMTGNYVKSKRVATDLVDRMLRECPNSIVGIQRIMRNIDTIWYTEKYENVLISFISLAKAGKLVKDSATSVLNVVAPILGGDALILRAIQMCRWIDALNERIKKSGTIEISRRRVSLDQELIALTNGLSIVKSLCIQLATQYTKLQCRTFDSNEQPKSYDISWSEDLIPEEGTPAQQPMTSSIGSASGGMLGKQSSAASVGNGGATKEQVAQPNPSTPTKQGASGSQPAKSEVDSILGNGNANRVEL